MTIRNVFIGAVNAVFFFSTRRQIRSPHLWAVIPTQKLRILRGINSSLIFWWSVASALSLLSMAYVDFGSLDLSFSNQLLGMLPLTWSILAVIQVRQLAKLKALQSARILEGPMEIDASPRFRELLEEYEARPSPLVLEALLRELGPTSRAFGFRRWRGRRDDFGL